MKTIAALASVAALAQSALAQSASPIINTPAAVVQCQPALVTFSGGQAPYFLSVLPGGQAGATPIELLPDQAAAGSYTWNVNVAAGTSITLQVRDGAGNINYSSQVTVQNSNDASCLGAPPSGATTSSGAVIGGGATGVPSATTAVPSTALTSTAATATVTAGAGSPTTNVTTSNGTSVDADSYNFTCTQGLLSYAITTATLNVSLSEATRFFSNWTGAAPGMLVNSTGTGVGATRAYMPEAGTTIQETLITNQTNATTGSLHQQWNLTAPVELGNVTVYSAFQDLTVYTNATTNATDAQWFILACPNDQQNGLADLSAFIDQGVAYFQQQISRSSNSTASPSAAPTTARSTATGGAATSARSIVSAAASSAAPAKRLARWL